MKDKVNKLLTERNGIITAEECLKNNINTMILSRMVKTKELERVARGIYSSPSADYDEYYLFSLTNKKAIFSHVCALYLQGLIDRIPFNLEVTLPYSYNSSHIDKSVIIHKAIEKYYAVGIIEVKTIYSNKVLCYNMERTIIDTIRTKKSIDIEIYTKAVNNYFRSGNRDYHRLREYARLFGVEKEVNDLLEVIG